MECPYCGSELIYHDYFGRLAAHQDGHVSGDIYMCPVGREDGECDSASFHVAGMFHVYRNDDVLRDGYPC